VNPSTDHPERPLTRRQVLAEIVLIFAVFFVQGAYPVPDKNEPNYLGKAIHYWNPQWGQGDFFLESKDAHAVFYFTFGWLSLFLSPLWFAWAGRVLTWGLMAWAWRRLSFAVVPRPWLSILTAVLFGALTQYCHLAGEWVIGGLEAKGFAFVLMFLGLEAMLRGRWNRTWLLLGAASAFHVLVGGWAVVAAAMTWLVCRKERPRLLSMAPALIGGLLLSLPGLIPALLLNRGVGSEIIQQANSIYVFGRLAHHLAPWVLPRYFPLQFALFASAFFLWLALCWMTPAEAPARRLRLFVGASVVIAIVGGAIGPVAYWDAELAAGLLKFYWFRLSDVAVPMGAALAVGSLVVWSLQSRPAVGKWVLAVAVTAACVPVGINTIRLFRRAPERAFRLAAPLMDPDRSAEQDSYKLYADWREICAWIAVPGNVPPDARFLTPKESCTFKWYTGRAEVVTWKEVPQDAWSIVQWWQRLHEIHEYDDRRPGTRWYATLAELGEPGTRRWRQLDLKDVLWARTPEEMWQIYVELVARWLRKIGRQYEADYVLTVAEPPLNLPVLHKNRSYVVYRLRAE